MGSIRLRFAEKEADIESLIPLYEEFHAKSHWKSHPFDADKIRTYLKPGLHPNKKGIIILAEDKTGVVGFLISGIGDYYFGPMRMATVYMIYVAETIKNALVSGRVSIRLVRTLEAWAKQHNCAEIHFSVTSGIYQAQTDRFFRKLGYKTLGGNYAKQVK